MVEDWITTMLRTNRDFSAGWNSALWEIRQQLDSLDPLVLFIEDLINEPDKEKE